MNINPGPARTVTPPSVAVLTPVNNGPSPDAFPQGGNGFRLLARYNNLQLQRGDTCVPVINTTRFIPIMAIFTNSLVNGIDTLTQPANVAAAQVGVYTSAGGPAAGTPPINQVIPANTLAGVTNGAMWAALNASGTIFPFNSPQASGQLVIPRAQPHHGQNGPSVFVFVSTPITGGTIDFFLYGYDMSDIIALPVNILTDVRPPFSFSNPGSSDSSSTSGLAASAALGNVPASTQPAAAPPSSGTGDGSAGSGDGSTGTGDGSTSTGDGSSTGDGTTTTPSS